MNHIIAHSLWSFLVAGLLIFIFTDHTTEEMKCTSKQYKYRAQIQTLTVCKDNNRLIWNDTSYNPKRDSLITELSKEL